MVKIFMNNPKKSLESKVEKIQKDRVNDANTSLYAGLAFLLGAGSLVVLGCDNRVSNTLLGKLPLFNSALLSLGYSIYLITKAYSKYTGEYYKKNNDYKHKIKNKYHK